MNYAEVSYHLFKEFENFSVEKRRFRLRWDSSLGLSIIIKFSIFTNKNSQSDTFLPKLKNTIVKIDIKSFSV